MARTKKIPFESVEKIAKKLRSLPAKDTAKTREEAVIIWTKEIAEAIEKGYSLKDISEILRSEDVEITPATLRVYINKAGRKSTKSETHPPAAMIQKNEKNLQNMVKKTQGYGKEKNAHNKNDAPKNEYNTSNNFVKEDMPDDEL